MADSEYSSIAITMPKVKISHLEKNAFIYEIDVATRWAKWHLQRKLNDFQELHKKLQAEFSDLPEFPSNILTYFLGENSDQAEENRQILEEYLRETSLRKDIVNTDSYTQFLQLEKHSPQMLASKPKLLSQFEMQQRINDEGKVILEFYYHQNFIVFATGNDNPIQKFNSLVANSKFPWEEEEEVEFVLPLGTVECWLKKKDTLQYKRVWARNYPIQVRKFIFNPESSVMAVGMADGAVQMFKLIQKPRYVYYEMVKMIPAHQQEVVGLHLDPSALMIYSVSINGWICSIQVNRSVLIDKKQAGGSATAVVGDAKNNRLFVALEEGNVQVYFYDHLGKVRLVHVLSTPAEGQIKSMLFCPVRNYFFAGVYDSGEIFIFQIGKIGSQKLSKQIGALKNKPKIVDMLWNHDKMQLLVSVRTGEMFFWNTVKGKQIYMLKAFDSLPLSCSQFIKSKDMIVTASRGRQVKFWDVPRSWRDASSEIEEEREIQIRRKVENLYKVREALKKKDANSDDDDLRGWHWSSSDEGDQKEDEK